MKRLLFVLCHPRLYVLMRKEVEHLVLFHTACMMNENETPTVWDIDNIHEMMNKILTLIYMSPEIRDWFKKSTPIVRDCLKWTLFLSRFKLLSVSREEVKRCFDLYENALNVVSKCRENPTMTDAIHAHLFAMNAFENGELK